MHAARSSDGDVRRRNQEPTSPACLRAPRPYTAQGASTDARVFIEMYAPHDPTGTSGEVRLLDIDTHAKPFGRDAVDVFVVSGAGRAAARRSMRQ